MNSCNKTILAGCAAIMAIATPASAREIDRIEIVQLVDPSERVVPKSSCQDEKTIPAGQVEKLKLCTKWRHELSYTMTRRFLVADAADKLPKDQRRLVEACLNRAAARAQTEARGADLLLADARVGFERCAVSSNIADAGAITLSFDDKSEDRRVR